MGFNRRREKKKKETERLEKEEAGAFGTEKTDLDEYQYMGISSCIGFSRLGGQAGDEKKKSMGGESKTVKTRKNSCADQVSHKWLRSETPPEINEKEN